jgi:hypothetical protein
MLSGVKISPQSDPLFNGTVVPSTPSTLSNFGDPPGRVGQWILGDSLDLVLTEWLLTGMVTLSRPDDATMDVTQVRFSVDLVNDTRLPTIPVPPAVWLFGSGFLILIARARRNRAA